MNDLQKNEADELLRELGLDPTRFRSEGGHLNAAKVRAAIIHPGDYAGLYLSSKACKRCGGESWKLVSTTGGAMDRCEKCGNTRWHEVRPNKR